MNQKPCVLLYIRNLVIHRASSLELSVNTTEESHTIGLPSIQIDNYEIFSEANNGSFCQKQNLYLKVYLCCN